MDIPLNRIDATRWEIPKSADPRMRVPGLIFATAELMKAIRKDQALSQVRNAAFAPGIVKASMAMPDIHFGYGFPIGGVVATRTQGGVICPGGVGFDINCGVRCASTHLRLADVEKSKKAIAEELYRSIPSGVGVKGQFRLNDREMRGVVTEGAGWAVHSKGIGSEEDLVRAESRGKLSGADPDAVSAKAYERGRSQVGTLGAGNHFCEIQLVEQVFDEKAAAAYGVEEGQILIMVHTGSRGFGHQVCTDFLKTMLNASRKYGIELPDRQLACTPYDSPEGRSYLGALACAANFAWANRQILYRNAVDALKKALGLTDRDLGARMIYDVAHNIVKMEEHVVDGKKEKLAVHRKGATRAFPPGHPEIPVEYQKVGQPVLIPGDMGTASYILSGTERAMDWTFGSTCHGAGRALSRKAALRHTKGRSIIRELQDRGIHVRSREERTVREEVPEAYKEIDEVIRAVHDAGISNRVARVLPLVVVKG